MDMKRKILLMVTWDIHLNKILPSLMFNHHQVLIHHINMFQKQILYFILHPLILILKNTSQMFQVIITKRRQNIFNPNPNQEPTILVLVSSILINMIIILHLKMWMALNQIIISAKASLQTKTNILHILTQMKTITNQKIKIINMGKQIQQKTGTQNQLHTTIKILIWEAHQALLPIN